MCNNHFSSLLLCNSRGVLLPSFGIEAAQKLVCTSRVVNIFYPYNTVLCITRYKALFYKAPQKSLTLTSYNVNLGQESLIFCSWFYSTLSRLAHRHPGRNCPASAQLVSFHSPKASFSQIDMNVMPHSLRYKLAISPAMAIEGTLYYPAFSYLRTTVSVSPPNRNHDETSPGRPSAPRPPARTLPPPQPAPQFRRRRLLAYFFLPPSLLKLQRRRDPRHRHLRHQ